jgi:hypothetical protein
LGGWPASFSTHLDAPLQGLDYLSDYISPASLDRVDEAPKSARKTCLGGVWS